MTADLDFPALYINTTLTRSPGDSHTQLLIDSSAAIMSAHGVTVDQFTHGNQRREWDAGARFDPPDPEYRS